MASMASSIKGFSDRLVYGAATAAAIGLTKAIATDITSQVIDFLSDESRFVTRQTILADGGVTI